jgi:hypothetical protein
VTVNTAEPPTQTLAFVGGTSMLAGGHSTTTPRETLGMPFVNTVASAGPFGKP